MRKAAAVAEAAGLNICLHGVYESGITTCASNQVAATIPNLDDGNQIMVQLLAEDIVASPSARHADGRLPVLEGPGLGFSWTGTRSCRGAPSATATCRPSLASGSRARCGRRPATRSATCSAWARISGTAMISHKRRGSRDRPRTDRGDGLPLAPIRAP